MNKSGTLEINSIDDMIRFRRIIAEAQGNIGLFWMTQDLDSVIPVETSTVQDIVANKVSLPKFISTQVTHADAWKNIPESTRVNAGGELENHKSIPRGFVAFEFEKHTFIIVGGDWLDEPTAEKIATAFGLTGAKYITYKNTDYNAQP